MGLRFYYFWLQVLAKGRAYHKTCALCHTCSARLDSLSLNTGADGNIYCKACLDAHFGSHFGCPYSTVNVKTTMLVFHLLLLFFSKQFFWDMVNCSNCDCSTRNCSTLLAANQLLDTKNKIARIGLTGFSSSFIFCVQTNNCSTVICSTLLAGK